MCLLLSNMEKQNNGKLLLNDMLYCYIRLEDSIKKTIKHVENFCKI